ncbi:MAG: pilus assembly protein, partial [Phycisphaerae bacterium]|nr:pilus assembly protein [Phycisphaerae bacterium]
LPVILVGIAIWMTGGGSSASQWLPRALVSSGVVKYAVITMVLTAGLLVVCVMLVRIGARARARDRSQDGGAIVEFALVLPIAVTLVLLLAQASFLMVGHLCVQYSAYCAARAAIVAIPDDLAQYGGEAQNYVDPEPNSSMKQGRILRAAAWAVMPVSCAIEAQAEASRPELVNGIEEFFSAYGESTPGWVKTKLQRKWQYAVDHTFVELEPPLSGDVYGEAEDIQVSVAHTFYLSVPMARTIFAAFEDGVELDIGNGEYGLVMRATCTLTNEGVQDYVDEETFPKDE